MKAPMSTRETLAAKEGLAALLCLALLTALAVVYPLESVVEAAEGQAKAPWIFVGLQQLLRPLPPLWGGLLLPGAAFCFLAWLPWLSRRPPHAVPALGRPGFAELAAWAILAGWALLTAYGFFA